VGIVGAARQVRVLSVANDGINGIFDAMNGGDGGDRAGDDCDWRRAKSVVHTDCDRRRAVGVTGIVSRDGNEGVEARYVGAPVEIEVRTGRGADLVCAVAV